MRYSFLQWVDIKEKILAMTEEELLDTVTVYDSYNDEFHPIKDWQVNVGDDVLHDGHAYMEF